MKRLFILILFSAILFSKEIILKKKEIKENNLTIFQESKIWIFNKLNSFTPEFLQVSPEDSLLKFKTSYDTREDKIKTSLNAKIIFPSFESKTSKINISKTSLSTQIFTFKIIPLLLMHKSILTPTIKTFLSLKNDYIIKYLEVAETIYYYSIHNEYKENTTFTINKIVNISNLKFKVSKSYYSTDKNNLYYLSGLYYYTTTNKFIRTYGFEISGNRKKLPVIYEYKLFFDYRHTLFNKKYIYIDLTPYLFASKEYHYQIKPAATISFNIRF